MHNILQRKVIPCTNKVTPLYLLLEPASVPLVTNPSTLVSVPPLGFYPSHPFTPHSSYYIIYKDNINNLSHLRPGKK